MSKLTKLSIATVALVLGVSAAAQAQNIYTPNIYAPSYGAAGPTWVQPEGPPSQGWSSTYSIPSSSFQPYQGYNSLGSGRCNVPAAGC